MHRVPNARAPVGVVRTTALGSDHPARGAAATIGLGSLAVSTKPPLRLGADQRALRERMQRIRLASVQSSSTWCSSRPVVNRSVERPTLLGEKLLGRRPRRRRSSCWKGHEIRGASCGFSSCDLLPVQLNSRELLDTVNDLAGTVKSRLAPLARKMPCDVCPNKSTLSATELC